MAKQTHGKSKTKAYRAWVNLRHRCRRHQHKDSMYYATLGISVCDRWAFFENFFADMGDPPTVEHTLDRIDPKLGYSPENCRWATRQTQSENRRYVMWVTYRGKRQTVKAWIREIGSFKLGCSKSTVYARINRGMLPATALGLEPADKECNP